MRSRPAFVRHSCVFAVALTAALAAAADWPNWCGPSHDGISPETGIPAKLDAPPAKLWENPIGDAYSGLSVVGDRVYTCGTADKKQMLLCLNADTGEAVWKTPIEAGYDSDQGSGTRATPTVSDGRVYILGAHGRLLCCDAATGKEIWSKQFNAMPQWGYSGSVLVEGDLAIAGAGGDDGGLVAFNKKTGEPAWKTEPAPVGYSTPYPFTFHDTRYIVGLLAKEAVIVVAATGEIAWRTPWTTAYDVNAATPIFHDGLLFIGSGYKTGSGVFKLTREGERLSGGNLWDQMPNRVILAKFQSPVLRDGHLYVSDEKALKCVELATGKLAWKHDDIGNGTVIIADGKLVVFTEGGELQIAALSPEKYEPAAKAQLLTGKCWTIPTLGHGRIYVRNLGRAACYKLAP